MHYGYYFCRFYAKFSCTFYAQFSLYFLSILEVPNIGRMSALLFLHFFADFFYLGLYHNRIFPGTNL